MNKPLIFTTPAQRVTLPTKSLLQGCTYRPAHSTDVRVTFAMYQARLMLGAV